MGLIDDLFERRGARDTPALKAAMARAISAVEPLLSQTDGYPERYRQPVGTALEYTTQLAARLPGPVTLDREAYAKDALVHALFPDIDAISVAFTSSLDLQKYLRESPPDSEFYALMGMRRIEKKIFGMEPAGMIVQRDVAQQVVYFDNHTIEAPSTSESLSRELIAMRFFDSLVDKVRERIDQRKKTKESLAADIGMLMPRLHTASDPDRSSVEQRIDKLTSGLQNILESLNPESYASDFEAVMLHPEESLRLEQVPIVLDSMGIRRSGNDADRGKAFTFSELIGYDRRDWTVTVVRCVNLTHETFAERLDQAYRRLKL